ncbi:alpha/beta hydrolase [Homoserinibacter sp. YIM 151385]|uniref:alpha/beta hydrolase n=1 Tax=Homoserinibacter sp. YIM 151385 TaxID=2985506 RepID=UPI0022F029AA|nr:alpha/beta hydrolase-fold protein [Homoserinibacter sp. YIM 151385]WBU37439.1 alpha/beta hydrolase-fold protein [Homoserinibacter sp. YIM 151385]
MTSILEGIERFDLTARATGRRYRVSVSAPEAPPASLPLVVVLDADLAFGTAAETAAVLASIGEARPAVVVGVGHGVPPAELWSRRAVDLTPGGSIPESMQAVLGTDSGGGEQLLDWILDELAPEIARRHPSASDEVALIGHSLGGLLAAHALLTRPGRLAAVAALSPALWWDGFAVLSHLAALPERLAGLGRIPRALVAVGGLEQTPPESLPEGWEHLLERYRAEIARTRVVDAAGELAASLAEAGIESRFDLLEGETHGTSIAPAVARAVGFVLAPRH